jgi:hypothetical protein
MHVIWFEVGAEAKNDRTQRATLPATCFGGHAVVGIACIRGLGHFGESGLLLELLKDPGVGEVENMHHERQVFPAEAGGFLPGVAVSKEASYGDRVPQTGPGAFAPNAGLDKPASYLVHAILWHAFRAPCS